MSRTIDERVVTLQFDNAEFERNVKTSMSSLDKLEKSLKFKDADEGFRRVNDAAEKTNFNPLIKAQVTVTEGFSAMERVAINVLSSIAIRAEQAGERLVRSLSIDQVSSGWGKYNDKIASVQTLVNSTGKSIDDINDSLDKLMWFSDETSYSFNDMTKSLAQLTSSGGKVENLMPMIMGIANATAFAGKSTQEFSRAIYNLNQSYGAGSLKYMDWKSLELAGVATKDLKQAFIDTAIELGKLSKSGKTAKGTLVELGNFGETLKEGWADTSVMEQTFGKFYQYTEKAWEMVNTGQAKSASEAYANLSRLYDDIYIKAARSAQEAKTFTEAIEATKDAVSTKWMKSFDLIFGNYDQSKDLFTKIANSFWDIFASGGDIRNDILSTAFDDDYTKLKGLFKKAGADFGSFNQEFQDFLVESGYDVNSLIKDYGSLSNAIAHNADILDLESERYFNLGERLKNYITMTKLNLTEYSSSTKDVAKVTEQLQTLFDNVWLGSFGNGEERVRKLKEANLDYATTQKLINKLAAEGHRAGYKLLANDIEHLTDAELKNMGITRKQASAISEALHDVSSEAADAQKELEDLIGTMGKKSSGRIYLADAIVNVLETIVAVQEIAREAWADVFSDVNFGEVLANAMEKLAKFTESVKNAVTESKVLRTIFESVFSVLKTVGKGFSLVYEVVRQLVTGGLNILSELFEGINIDVKDFSTSVGEAFDKAVEWLRQNEPIINLIESASAGVAKVMSNVKTWISSFIKIEDVTSIFTGIKKSIEGFIGTDFGITSLTAAYNSLIDSVVNGSSDPFQAVGQNITKFFSNFVSSFAKFRSDIKTGFYKAFDDLKWSQDEIDKLTETFRKLFEVLAGVGAGYVFLNMFTKLAGALESLASPFKTISDLIKSAQGTFNAITAYFKAQANNMFVNNILKIAIAIGVLAGSMYALATIGDSNTLWTAILATGALLAIIAGFSWAMAQISKINSGDGKKAQINMKELALVIVSLAGSILLISHALKSLDNVENIWRNLIVIALMMAGVVVAVNFVKNKKMIISSIFDMIGIALAILILTKAVAKLDKLKLRNPKTVLLELGGIILSMIAVSWALKGVNKSSAFVLIAFASSLAGFVKVLESFAALDRKDYLTGLLRMTPIIGAMIGIMLALKQVPQSSVTGAAAYLVATAVSVLLIGKSVEKLGALKVETLIQGGLAAITLFGVIGIIGAGAAQLAFVQGATIRAAIGTSIIIIAMAGSLYLMAGAIMIFKNLDPSGLWRSVGVIASLLGAIGTVLFMIGKGGLFAEKTQAYAAVAALGKFALIIGVLAASLAVLSFVPTEGLISAAVGMMAVIGALSLLTVALKEYNVGDMLTAFGTVVLILGTVAGVIFALTSIPNVDKALPVAQALSEVLLALGATFIMGSVANWISKGLGAIDGFVPMLVKMGVVIGLLAGVIGLIETAFPQATEYILGLLDKVGAIISKLGEIIGGFIGTTIGAIGTGFTEQLVKVGENLSTFSESVKNFVNMTVPESFDHTLSSFVSLLTSLGGQVGNVKKIAQLSENSAQLSSFLTDFGAALALLSTSMAEVNVDNLNSAAAVGSMFAELNNSLGPDGFMAFLSGKQTLSTFSDNLKKFGIALVHFSEDMNDFNRNAVLDAMPAIEKLISLEGSLQSSGSLLGLLMGGEKGNKSLADFGTRAKEFGKGLADMSAELAKFDPKSVQAAISAGEALTALEKGLNDSWNLVGWLGTGEGGNKSLGDFGNRIQEFAAGLANGLNAFATLGEATEQARDGDDFVGPMNKTALNFEKVSENIDWIVEISEKFTSLENSLGESSSLFGAKSNLKSFGDGLGEFSIGFKKFTENLPEKMPDGTMVSNMIGMVEQFVRFTNEDGLNEDSGSILASIGTGISNMVTAFQSTLNTLFSSDSFAAAGGEEAVASTGFLSSIAEKIKNIFGNEEIIKGVKEKATTTGTGYFTSLTELFSASVPLDKTMDAFGTTAENLTNKFVEDDKKKTYSDKFKDIGADYMNGLIDGLAAREDALYSKAYAIAEKVTSILRKAWDVNSPSRVAFEIGQFFTMGLANGIDDMSQSAVDNAEEMALTVRDAVLDAMVISDQMLENSLSPIISPVLDTANVVSGAGVISSLLHSGASYSAALSVEDARALAFANLQNGGTNGTVITMNNTFEINGISRIDDPALVNDMANKLYNRINVLLGASV